MQLTTLLASFVVAALAVAEVDPRNTNGTGEFNVMALSDESEINFALANAAMGSLLLRLPESNATCTDNKNATSAYMFVNNGTLILYDVVYPFPRFFVDASGMGQGVLQYTFATDMYAPKYADFYGWKVDDSTGDLTWRGNGLLACPHSIDGSWSVWVAGYGSGNPAGNQNCTGFTARTWLTKKPVQCNYTLTRTW